MKLWYFHRFSVFVWTGDYDSNMLRVRICLKMEIKISVIKNIPILLPGQSLYIYAYFTFSCFPSV